MTDTDALTERIARVLHEIDPITGHGHDWGKLTNAERRFYRHKAAAVLPIVAEEVRTARVRRDAEREAAQMIRDACDRWEVDGDDERLVNDVLDPWTSRVLNHEGTP